jgi:hypothetical protein
MASPDFRPYVDLTIYDKQPGDLYDEAVDYASTALPEFSPRTGTVEDALLQATSYVGGQLIAAINRLPDGLMDGIMNLFGLVRKEASFATGTAIFTAVDSAGANIPTGTQVGYIETTSSGTILHVFETIEPATITAGNTTSSQVDIQAVTTGSVPSLVVDDPLIILTQTNRLLSAKIGADVTQGLAAETDAEYFTRGATFLSGLTQGLVTSTQITNRVLSLLAGTSTPDNDFTGVTLSTGWRCNVYDLTDLTVVEPTGNFVRSSGTVTVTVPSGHGIGVNDEIQVSTPDSTSAFDGYFTVTSSNATDISWAQSGTNASATAVNSYIYHLDGMDTAAADAAGNATIVICDEHGDSLKSADFATIVNDVTDRTVAGLTINYMPAMIVPISCSIDIVIKAGYSSFEVLAAVEEYIESVVSPANWDWASEVKANLIIARVSQVEGVDYVDSVTFDSPTSAIASLSAGNIVFPYKGTLPQLTATIGEA